MQKVSTEDLKRARKALEEAGYAITGWARARGYKYWTVYRLLRGERGLRKGGEISNKILKDLEAEGFLKTREQHSKAA